MFVEKVHVRGRGGVNTIFTMAELWFFVLESGGCPVRWVQNGRFQLMGNGIRVSHLQLPRKGSFCSQILLLLQSIFLALPMAVCVV